MIAEPVLASDPTADARRWLPLIVGLAVGIRLALGWMHPFLFPDSTDYEALARTIVAHQSYQVAGNVASRMPGYPILLALFYACGGSVRSVLAAQAFMGGGIVIFTYLIGIRIRQSVALMAALLVALDPLSIGFSAALLSETPFTLCMMAGIWTCVRISEERSIRRLWVLWISLGLLWGIAVYFRASALWCIVPVAICGVCVIRERHAEMRILMGLGAIALVFLLLAPWLVRNYGQFHSRPLRLTTLEGISLYEAVYPEADGGPRQDKIALPHEMQNLNEAQQNDEWSRRAWEFVRHDPARMAKLALIKIGRTWSPTMNAADFQSRPIQWAMMLWYVPLFFFGMLGIVVGLPSKVYGFVMIPIVYFTVVHALFLGSVRYRVPLMPLVCLMAAVSFVWLGNMLIGGKRSRQQ